MKEGDADTYYAYYCFHKQKMLPSEYIALPIHEKVLIMTFIDEHLKNEKDAQRKARRKK